MGRQTDWQTNPWGKTVEVQRSDLWIVDLNSVVAEYRQYGYFPKGREFNGGETKFYAQSVDLPEQKVSPEVVRRDSRPYHMPSWDEPLGAITITFNVDVGQQDQGAGHTSEILKLLTAWRAVVRAGRGGMSVEDSFLLSSNWSTVPGARNVPVHAFNIPVTLIKGYGTPGRQLDDSTVDSDADVDRVTEMNTSTSLILVNAWLSAFKLGQLSYSAGITTPLTVAATLYADDIALDTGGRARQYLRVL